jgi:hypothetical protein
LAAVRKHDVAKREREREARERERAATARLLRDRAQWQRVRAADDERWERERAAAWERVDRERAAARGAEVVVRVEPAEPPHPPRDAQRVVLYEEDPADPGGKRFIGSAIWRTETVSPGGGQAADLAVRCDVEIAERRLALTMSIRRNRDQALPASHTVEVMFKSSANFPFGGISNVPGLLMKQAEQARGTPLSGLAVKVTSGFFLLGLSAVETEAQRNFELLKERSWFDIPVVYNGGRRAIITVEKGASGERAFAEAFKSWGQ